MLGLSTFILAPKGVWPPSGPRDPYTRLADLLLSPLQMLTGCLFPKSSLIGAIDSDSVPDEEVQRFKGITVWLAGWLASWPAAE